MNKRSFHPTEIIFAATNACNLHCKHCFIERNPHKLQISDAITLLENCVQNAGKTDNNGHILPTIEKIGFSGGEPFLYMDFLLEVTKAAVSQNLLFDQIMTNGDWWNSPNDLFEKLTALYNAGYDGKIGLSWDSYHAQKKERMKTFIKAVQEVFGNDSINIQTVDDTGGESLPLASEALVEQGSTNASSATSSAGGKPASLVIPATPPNIQVYHLPRTYTSENPCAWQSRKWFREDYCEGPGHILYVHANGNIAPCCGFANENKELFIGRITDSLETIMQNASKNPLIKICFQQGLSHFRRHELKKMLRAKKEKLPGRTNDICTFCDYVCKNCSK